MHNVGLSSAQARLCDPWTSGDLRWNAAGWSQHQLHQQPILRLHHHPTRWKVTADIFTFIYNTRSYAEKHDSAATTTFTSLLGGGACGNWSFLRK